MASVIFSLPCLPFSFLAISFMLYTSHSTHYQFFLFKIAILRFSSFFRFSYSICYNCCVKYCTSLTIYNQRRYIFNLLSYNCWENISIYFFHYIDYSMLKIDWWFLDGWLWCPSLIRWVTITRHEPWIIHIKKQVSSLINCNFCHKPMSRQTKIVSLYIPS